MRVKCHKKTSTLLANLGEALATIKHIVKGSLAVNAVHGQFGMSYDRVCLERKVSTEPY